MKKDQSITSLVITISILIAFPTDCPLIMLWENWCWSLLRLKRLSNMAYVPADRQETDQQLFLTLKGMDIFSVSIALQQESSVDQVSLLLPFGLNSYVKKVLATFTRKIHNTVYQSKTIDFSDCWYTIAKFLSTDPTLTLCPSNNNN